MYIKRVTHFIKVTDFSIYLFYYNTLIRSNFDYANIFTLNFTGTVYFCKNNCSFFLLSCVVDKVNYRKWFIEK